MPYAFELRGQGDHESDEEEAVISVPHVECVDDSVKNECSPVNLMTKYGQQQVKLHPCVTVIEESMQPSSFDSSGQKHSKKFLVSKSPFAKSPVKKV